MAGLSAHQLNAKLLRQLRRYLRPRHGGEGDTAERGVTAGARVFLAPARPAAEWAPEVIPEPRARLWRQRRGMPRTGTGLCQPETQ